MKFTTDWFLKSPGVAVWQTIIEMVKPTNILEVGCFEGRATTFLIEGCPGASITCVDPWEGSVDIPPALMLGVEDRFDKNTAEALSKSSTTSLTKYKMRSSQALPMLLSQGRRFDFIYVDGSHTAPDVLCDAVDCFRLLREGGALIFDDYVWAMEPPGEQDLINMPKPAIDAFVNLNRRKIKLLHISDQLALLKTKD